MVVAKKYVLVKHSEGFPKPTDFKLVEEQLPPLKENEYLTEAVFLSVDPYMRAYMPRVKPNTTMIGSQIAKIVESKSPKFPVGRYVVGQFGWRSHTVASESGPQELGLQTFLLPDFQELPVSLGLGVLGMPGNTAYFGLLELCQPKAGETVVISGAAGAVGSLVGQIAKIKGCIVIGIAGSDEKGKWLTEELGFDYFINYKTQNVEEELRKAAPQGVDCYYDNVGGEITTTVLNQMNAFGRVALSGSISSYNSIGPFKVTTPNLTIVLQQLKLEGFIVTRWNHRWMEGIQQNLQWIQQGKLKYRETVTEGFENIFKAFTDMLEGVNVGKAIVKV
ncbi:prostaglandin reductase 1-like isoform X2 [Dendroctonus ponderosae]|uniref:prostaglandin reductase 1-like isoform X2 n=1 Tax=Dendroctonus ponderosae TaxID=77166 RepID=UPI0020365FD0|nr:prostaglandin reductase 1-like isoform X2 [Dendroctonus ponderosae]